MVNRLMSNRAPLDGAGSIEKLMSMQRASRWTRDIQAQYAVFIDVGFMVVSELG